MILRVISAMEQQQRVFPALVHSSCPLLLVSLLVLLQPLQTLQTTNAIHVTHPAQRVRGKLQCAHLVLHNCCCIMVSVSPLAPLAPINLLLIFALTAILGV